MKHSLENLPIFEESLLESVAVLKALTRAHRYLAELKGVAKSIPNEGILISTLTMQEAKDSSAIENIMTTHDELFRADIMKGEKINQSVKEVENYRQALWKSYQQIQKTGLLRVSDILQIQKDIEPNKPGIRKIPGTVIANARTKQVIYTPPQHPDEIQNLLSNLVSYINDDQLSDIDPLIKMAVIHHQFESIHPFYDGNGRTGRIINILYLINNDFLDLPVLYLSRYIVRTKSEYYRFLQSVRDHNEWQSWVLYMIKGIEQTARETITFINQIKILVLETKQKMRIELPAIYSQELLNNLFFHPYTKVQFVMDQVGVSRITATKYLNQLSEKGFIRKHKIGRTNYFVNEPLVRLIVEQEENE
ncbi:MAG: Fic family protein [Gammaproteobacteria bacterium]|nr:Fic family protein [Gammaproteobacteria bacterium]